MRINRDGWFYKVLVALDIEERFVPSVDQLMFAIVGALAEIIMKGLALCVVIAVTTWMTWCVLNALVFCAVNGFDLQLMRYYQYAHIGFVIMCFVLFMGTFAGLLMLCGDQNHRAFYRSLSPSRHGSPLCSKVEFYYEEDPLEKK